MTIADEPVHHHSYHIQGVATCDLLEREPATIVAFDRDNPPYSRNPIMELRFFGPFPQLNVWSHIATNGERKGEGQGVVGASLIYLLRAHLWV